MIKQSKLHKNNGFTLAELLIVVAILGILVSIAVPMFGDAIKTAQAEQCKQNRLLLTRAALLARALEPAEDAKVITDKVLENARNEGGEYFATHCECPVKDAAYSYDSAQNEIICSIHGGTEVGDINTGDTRPIEIRMRDTMANMIENLKGMTAAEAKKAYPELVLYGTNMPSNDNLRAYIRDYIYKGTWPTLSPEFLKKNGFSDTTFYIQCFINQTTTDLPTYNIDEVVIYGTTSNGGGYSVPLVYDIDSKTWYKRTKPNGALDSISLPGNTGIPTYSAFKKNLAENPSLWKKMES